MDADTVFVILRTLYPSNSENIQNQGGFVTGWGGRSVEDYSDGTKIMVMKCTQQKICALIE